MYQVKQASRREWIAVRNLQYHVHVWGEPAPDKHPIFLLHGWMDVAASFQFMVDALQGSHYIIAPDWRGYGHTATGNADTFWFPDYLADLDCLIDHYAGETPVVLVGHSMGGNVALLYAGVRPQRVHRLINLEGLGTPATTPSQAPGRYAKWMDEVKALHRGALDLHPYDSAAAVARRLMKTNRRLSPDQALWLAHQWAQEGPDGAWRILGQAGHKITSAQGYRADEAIEVYRCITAPTLSLHAADDTLQQWWKGTYTLADFHDRLKVIPRLELVCVEDAGHMMHHDQPQVLADLIERFIG